MPSSSEAIDHRATPRAGLATTPPSVPTHTAWLPQSCCWNCMTAASMQYEPADQGSGRSISGPESTSAVHEHHEYSAERAVVSLRSTPERHERGIHVPWTARLRVCPRALVPGAFRNLRSTTGTRPFRPAISLCHAPFRPAPAISISDRHPRPAPAIGTRDRCPVAPEPGRQIPGGRARTRAPESGRQIPGA
jgi:hypothetical protein